MWKMTFQIFVKSQRFETLWVRKNGFYDGKELLDCASAHFLRAKKEEGIIYKSNAMLYL